MSRKQESTKESVLAGALDLIEKHGMASFSVRNVAKHLQISTQPIYSYFGGSSDLYNAVLAEIERQLLAQIEYPYSEFVFRNMGYGFVLFAKEHPNLFSTFFHPNEVNEKFIKVFLEKLRVALDLDERFIQISSKGKDGLMEKMWTFSYGYAFLIVRGLVPNDSEKAIKDMILEVGTAVIVGTMKEEGLMG